VNDAGARENLPVPLLRLQRTYPSFFIGMGLWSYRYLRSFKLIISTPDDLSEAN
jgi:hypothetical protein